MQKKIDKEMINELFELIVSMENTDDCKALFDDLCTIKEVEQMAQRVRAAKLMLEGKTYNQVTEATDISSATLSRISRCIQHGNGYSRFLKQCIFIKYDNVLYGIQPDLYAKIWLNSVLLCDILTDVIFKIHI